jgi:hypothetical protein
MGAMVSKILFGILALVPLLGAVAPGLGPKAEPAFAQVQPAAPAPHFAG